MIQLNKISFQTNCYTWIPYGYTGLYPGGENTLDYALRNLAKLGYDGVEIDCFHILDTRLWTISKEQRKLLKKAIADLGIEIEAFSAHEWPLPYASFTSMDKESKRLGMEWTKGVIDLATDFGTKIVTAHVPSPQIHASKLLPGMPRGLLRGMGDRGPMFGRVRPYTDDERKLMIQGVGECADYCKDRKVIRIRPWHYDEKYTRKQLNPWKIKRNGRPSVNLTAASAVMKRRMECLAAGMASSSGKLLFRCIIFYWQAG